MLIKSGIHYILRRHDGKIISMDFTAEGDATLPMAQKSRIEAALFAHKLGDSFAFPDIAIPVYEPQPMYVDEEIESGILTGPCEWEPEICDWRQDPVLGDKLYEDAKARKLLEGE